MKANHGFRCVILIAWLQTSVVEAQFLTPPSMWQDSAADCGCSDCSDPGNDAEEQSDARWSNTEIQLQLGRLEVEI